MNSTKHTILALLLIIISLSSCVNHIDEEQQNATISFNISNYSQSDFELPQSRTKIATVISHLSFCVFGDNAEKEQEILQASSDNGFGVIKTTIPYGTHSILVIGHNSSNNAIITSPGDISFANGKITDTFLYYSSIEIDEETSSTISVALDRTIAKFELQATDAIPSGVKTIEFKFSGGGNTLSGITGRTTSSIEQTKVIEVPANYINTSNNKFVLYTFLPEEESNFTIVATAKNEEKDILFSKTFSGVPLKINRVTRYKGEFFKDGENIAGDITVNDLWLDALECPF